MIVTRIRNFLYNFLENNYLKSSERIHNNTMCIVITGIGVLSPIGLDKESFWTNLNNGVCGISDIKSFDISNTRHHKGCELKGFEVTKKHHEYGRASLYTIETVKMAIKDAGLNLDEVNLDDVGISIGTGLGEIIATEEVVLSSFGRKTRIDDPCKHWQNNHSLIAANTSSFFGFGGPSTVLSTACSAGNDALAYAYTMLKQKKANIMIAGGVDTFSHTAYIGFTRLNAMSAQRCQPFDKDRKGIIIGEGCGILVLENYENAVSRGADIYAQIAGYGTSCDAYHITAPNPSTDGGMIMSIENALRMSDTSIDSVDFICAHGTGTPVNDKIESAAIHTVYGEFAEKIPLSAIKSSIGHTGGASGAIGSVVCAMAIKNGRIPPVINYYKEDPDCRLNIVKDKCLDKQVSTAINHSFAFGGNNTCIILKRV